MREIDISTIMIQLGFSSAQMERWQQIHQKEMSQSPDLVCAPIVNFQTPLLIHNTSILATSESIVI